MCDIISTYAVICDFVPIERQLEVLLFFMLQFLTDASVLANLRVKIMYMNKLIVLTISTDFH